MSNLIKRIVRATIPAAWILQDGTWNDSGVWDDTETWNDS